MDTSKSLINRYLYQSVILLAMLLCSLSSHAEQKKSFAEYDVHYSVVNTPFLSPEVATSYGITRGKNRAIVMISVRKQLADGSNIEKKALVSGTSFDLIHTINLDFNEIIENGAIYYIAEFTFNDKDLRRFDIKVQPDPNIEPYLLTFSQKIYFEKH